MKQIGHAILTVTPQDGAAPVEYLITLPRLRIDGLWYGSPYIELAESTHICGGNFISTIEYKGKGYFSGKSHQFKAVVAPAPGTGGVAKEHVIDGLWHTTSKFVSGPKSGISFHDVNGPKEEVTVGSEEKMDPFETRKLWKLVAKGIREQDFDAASREKSKIEVYLFSNGSHPRLKYHYRTTSGKDDAMKVQPEQLGL